MEALTGFVVGLLQCPDHRSGHSRRRLGGDHRRGGDRQLGAMRIIGGDRRLEVMGIRSVAYLASTRVIAGVIVVIPLYCIAR